MPNTREKLVDIVCDAAQINGCIHSCNHPPCKMVSVIVDALMQNGVTVQEWISVKDRLPEGNKPGEISENVIVRTTDGEVTTGWLDALGSDKWWLVIGTDDSHTCWGLGYVTHWMPLPVAPKEE